MHDRYYEEYYRLRNKEKAILSAFSELFVPSLSGILTDAFGVLVIFLVPVVFLQRLAITASFWIAAIIVSELLLNPIVYYYLAPPHLEVIEKREHGWFKRMLEAISAAMLKPVGRTVTFATTLSVIALCAFFLDRPEGRRSNFPIANPVAELALQSSDGKDPGGVFGDRTIRRRM
jgi:predicted RND superfamily exporter protein